MSGRKVLSVAAAVAGTVLFMALAAHNVDFSQLRRILAAARWRWLPAMVFIVLFADLGLRALRWRILLSEAVKAPLGKLYRLSAIGLAVNNLLFARLGELLRAVLASRELGVPWETALASVVVERALDVAALLSLFVFASTWLPDLVPLPVRNGGIVVLAGVLAALAFLTMAERTLEPGGLVESRLRSWPKAHELVAHLALGAAVLRRPPALLQVVGLSLGLWAVDAMVFWIGAYALGLQEFIDYPRAILVLSWGGAGSALPAVPGALGTFEAMIKSIVTTLGASPDQAFAYAVFLHMCSYILVTTVGLIFLYRIGLSLSGIKESLRSQKP